MRCMYIWNYINIYYKYIYLYGIPKKYDRHTHKHIKYMYTYIHIYINRENISYNFFKSHLPNKCRTTAWQPDEPDDVLTMSRWDVQGELEPRAIPWSSLTNRTARSEIETLQKPQNFLTVGKHVMVYHGFPVFLTHDSRIFSWCFFLGLGC